jgi:regulator of protease activity HflC (stomatin/prohibitin superfamily)
MLRDNISDATTRCSIEVERFEMKDVELPEAMQQAMARESEAIRESELP